MIEELHTQIVTCQHNLARAQQENLTHDIHLYSARLEDLADMASRHGIDVSAWLDRSLLKRDAAAD